MLFNSLGFIFVFLPSVVVGYYFIGKAISRYWAIIFLVLASLVFYAWWNPIYIVLIAASIIFNYYVSFKLTHQSDKKAKTWLILGIIVNLSAIGYFKYFNFFVDNINVVLGASFNFENIILPLAISFFTFQQISFLVDRYKGKINSCHFVDYALFVTFFPQLIAGPIVHHQEMMPQFLANNKFKLNWEFLAVGITIFIFGLFKKVVIADNIAKYSSPVFLVFDQGGVVPFFGAWSGALAYSFQLYFDFSGYSDMAYGLALIFGIRLPVNFFSPYKSESIICFWRRWHMTLSRFLRDYLYIPLGGNKIGVPRRHLNIFITMLIGGLWHGASWTFVLWGGLHGVYIMVNHAWHHLFNGFKLNTHFSRFITFIFVTIAWVLFRAETLDGAFSMIRSMSGVDGIAVHYHLRAVLDYLPEIFHIASNSENWFGPNNPYLVVPNLLALYLFVNMLPNTYQYMKVEQLPFRNNELCHKRNNILNFNPNSITAYLLAIVTLWIFSSWSINSEFLYFQF